MNIWDSVHRGLEKASQEAGRIAKAQRLRYAIDGLQRQTQTQNTILVSTIMELFISGQLTQSELIPLCQEMSNLRQQIEMAQNELKTIQQGTPSSATHSQQPGEPTLTEPFQPSGEMAPVPPPPPGYQPYPDISAPPPPPGIEPSGTSESETGMAYQTSLPISGIQTCSTCGLALTPGSVFCPNCGSQVQANDGSYLPTVRGGPLESIYPPPGLQPFPSSTPPSPPFQAMEGKERDTTWVEQPPSEKNHPS